MSAIPPALPSAMPAANAINNAVTANLAVLLSILTKDLAALPAGSVLSGLVTRLMTTDGAANPPGSSVLQVATAAGPIELRVGQPVAVGASLQIAILQAGPQPQWRLLAIDNRPVGPAPGPAIATPPVEIAADAAGATTLSAGQPQGENGLMAVLLRSSDPALPSGTHLLVRIVEVTPDPAAVAEEDRLASAPPAAPAEPAAVTRPAPPMAGTEMAIDVPTDSRLPTLSALPEAGSVAAPAVGATILPAAAAPAPSPPPPPTGPTIVAPPLQEALPLAATIPATAASAVTVAAPDRTIPFGPVTAPPAASATPADLAPSSDDPLASAPPRSILPSPQGNIAMPSELSGPVLANSDDGRPLLQTAIGVLALPSDPHSPPPGSMVTLLVIDRPSPPALASAGASAPPEVTLLSQIRQLLAALPEASGKLSEKLMAHIPAPGPKLAAQLLSLLPASPENGLRRWLGENLLAALAHAAPEALSSLSQHWTNMAQPVHGPADGVWEKFVLPLMLGGVLTPLTISVRQRGGRGQGTGGGPDQGARFLLDLELSRLGRLQFDGLVQRQSKRFDLILRSDAPLSGEMRRDIDGLFINGLLSFGMEGSVSFKHGASMLTTPPLTAKDHGIIFA